jgi:gluconate kinase
MRPILCSNEAKMARGEPLDDVDRGPWLLALRKQIDWCLEGMLDAVVVCSALKQVHCPCLDSLIIDVTTIVLFMPPHFNSAPSSPPHFMSIELPGYFDWRQYEGITPL